MCVILVSLLLCCCMRVTFFYVRAPEAEHSKQKRAESRMKHDDDEDDPPSQIIGQDEEHTECEESEIERKIGKKKVSMEILSFFFYIDSHTSACLWVRCRSHFGSETQ